jgi:ADP-heptose:LPS heptosyltransferase
MAVTRVVVLRNLGLGDLLTGIPALRALRRVFAGHEVVLVAPEVLAPLAELSGAVDRVTAAMPVDSPHVAVNLHGRGPESHRLVLAARPRRLVAFEHAEVPESRGMPPWRPDEHEVARWCRLLDETGIPADPHDLRLDVELFGPPGATLIHPGAASGSRRWPAERFAAVARAERELGRDVVVTGGPDEVGLARTIADHAGLPDRAVYAGRTSVTELAGLVAAAGRVVCGDTGVAHLATAVGTPSVVLFGPIAPGHWGPPPSPNHRALWAGLPGDPHAQDVHAGLLAIDVCDVLAELERLEAAA